MNVFVTGGTGGLGRALLPALAARGHRVTALARNPAALPAIPGLTAVAGDLLAPRGLVAALAGCRAVLHLAAVTHAPRPEAYSRVNVEGTAALLAACREACPEARFVFVGTRAVGAACGAYGASKARAEALVRGSGLSWVILRPAEVYGVGKGEAIAALARSCARGGLVLLPGSGRHTLAPVHVDDVVAATIAALDAPAAPGRTYTLAGPEEIGLSDLADRLAAARGRRILKVPVPLFLLRAAALVLSRLMARPPLVPDQTARLACPKDADIGPARADLGFAPRPLLAGLRDMPA